MKNKEARVGQQGPSSYYQTGHQAAEQVWKRELERWLDDRKHTYSPNSGKGSSEEGSGKKWDKGE